MGDVLDYERGKLGIGRFVRVVGHRNGHATVAKLTGAEKWKGVVRLAGHGHDERIDWRYIQDWPSKNGGTWPEPTKPMPVIRRVPELTALEHKELKAMQTPKPVTVPAPNSADVAALRVAVDAAGMLDLGELGARIKSAVADVEAARILLRNAETEAVRTVQAAREEMDRQVGSLGALRQQALKALAMIDAAAGT